MRSAKWLRIGTILINFNVCLCSIFFHFCSEKKCCFQNWPCFNVIVPSWGRSLIFDRSSDNCKAVEVSSVEAFMPVYIWEEICWPYRAWLWCHISGFPKTNLLWLGVVLWQKLKEFLKIYALRSVYTVHTSVWTTLAIGACLKVDTFTLPCIFAQIHSLF